MPESRTPERPNNPRPPLEVQHTNSEAPRSAPSLLKAQPPKPKIAVPTRGGAGMAASLMSAITRMDSAGKIRESLALAYWERVVGETAAAATEAESVRDGILFVRTKSSVWSHELTLHKARILLNLNRMLGGKIILDIVFRAQGVTKEEAPKVDPDTPSEEELAAVVLEDDERQALRVRLQKLYTLKDERIREAIASRITHEARLRHWRLERGWRVCRRCDAIHKTEFTICPSCRLNWK